MSDWNGALFAVYVLCRVASVDFRAETGENLRLADYLPNGPHELRLVTRGDGAVTVEAFDVFQPAGSRAMSEH